MSDVKLVSSVSSVRYESTFELDPKNDLMIAIRGDKGKITVELEKHGITGSVKYVKQIILEITKSLGGDFKFYHLKGEFPLEMIPRLVAVLEEIYKREFRDELPDEEDYER